MKKNLLRLAIILLIPAAFVFGIYIGYDIHQEESTTYTQYLIQRDDLMQEKMKLGGEQIDTFYSFDAGDIPAKEARDRLEQLQEQVRQKNEELEALDAKIKAEIETL